MNVSLLNFTSDPEKTVSLAAKLCYSDASIGELSERLQGTSTEKFLNKILSLGHLSVLEHASFTFGVEGISRATSHQLVRHRIASFSQQSQRYVKMENTEDEFVVPDSYGPEAKEDFLEFVSIVKALYEKLIASGVPKEDARFVLPNAAATKIIVTMNARELLHFFELRCCERAQWEIRDMATRMLAHAKKAAPVIFKNAGPACTHGPCSEGEMTCGKIKEVRAKFKGLRPGDLD